MRPLLLPATITRRRLLQGAAVGAALSLLPALARAQAHAGAARLDPSSTPTLFAHRGASALRPEHTLAAYARAIADGADYIEPDLVCTRDGVLVARHENAITDTTDVGTRPEFAGRKNRKVIDGEAHDGWFVSDFTFAEIKTLRAVERLPKLRGTAWDGQFQVVSFEEIIDFVAAESAARGRTVGIIPELKHSTWFAANGLPLEDRFVSTLRAHAYTRRAPVEIQSFEIANLKALRKTLGRPANVRLMQLAVAGGKYDAVRPADVVAAGGTLTFGAMVSPRGLREVATYADVIAPITRAVIPLGPDERLLAPTSLVSDAHQAGLLVHVWTFRPENVFLAADFRNDAGPNARNEAGSIAEIRRYLETGIDGLFSDDSAVARRAHRRLIVPRQGADPCEDGACATDSPSSTSTAPWPTPFPFFLSVFNVDRRPATASSASTPPAPGNYRGHWGIREHDGAPRPAGLEAAAGRAQFHPRDDEATAPHTIPAVRRRRRRVAPPEPQRGMRLAVVSSNAEHNVRTGAGAGAGRAWSARFECGMSVFGKASRIRAVLRDQGMGSRRPRRIYIGDQDTRCGSGIAQGRTSPSGRCIGATPPSSPCARHARAQKNSPRRRDLFRIADKSLGDRVREIGRPVKENTSHAKLSHINSNQAKYIYAICSHDAPRPDPQSASPAALSHASRAYRAAADKVACRLSVLSQATGLPVLVISRFGEAGDPPRRAGGNC